MANTLTNLSADLYIALDTVSRELTGLIPAVSRDSSAERAALNQTVRSFVAPASTASDVTPGQLPADNGDQTIGNKTMSITKSRYVPIRWNGEQQRDMNNSVGYNPILRNQFAQAMRTLVNEVESDLASLYVKASNAVAPSGTTLFDANNYKDIANARKMLVDNGAPISDMQLVLNTTAGAALRGNAQITGADTSGSTDILRQGILLPMQGISVRESAQINSVAAGDAASATTNDAGYAVGATVITLASAGTGAILAGDAITFNGDTNVYVVASGDADVSGGGNIILQAPGLKKAIPASATAITVNASTDKNMLFDRSAIHLVTRAPARPVEGDAADDVMIVQDPRSGLAFEVAAYKEYRQIKYEVSLAWGYEVMKNEHFGLLLD